MIHSAGFTLDLDETTLDSYSNIPELDSSNDYKFRSIPVDQILDKREIRRSFCENVSGVKEVEDVNHYSKSKEFHTDTMPMQNSRTLTSTWQEQSKFFEPAENIKSLQSQLYPDLTFFDRIGQFSISEPTLPSAKYKGDFNFHDIYKDDNFKANRHFADNSSSPNRGIHGYVYIKRDGKVYKSKVEAKCLQSEENVAVNLSSKQQLGGDVFETDGYGFPDDDNNDFEVAIFLSGITKIPQNKKQKHRDQNFIERKSKHKAKKSKGSKKATQNFPVDYDSIDGKNSQNSCMKVNKNTLMRMSANESQFNYQDKNKSRVCLEPFNNASDVEDESADSVRSSKSDKERQHDGDRLSLKSRESTGSNRTRILSNTTVTPYVCEYIPSKPKVNEQELWKTFEVIFKTYASTSRHSGEVIPRNISTEWMKDAGVVDSILTEKQADDAFRNAAGAKITMNAQEYKDFLIMLTLRMKLPYYEIYSRMCGV